MPSPFPGMNPYLEYPPKWADFHNTYIPALRAALLPQVSPKYDVEIQEHLYSIEADMSDLSLIGVSDLDVIETWTSPSNPAPTTTVTIPRPREVTIPGLVEERFSYLEVVDGQSEKVITVIELLSPANKIGEGHRNQYLAKRRKLIESGINFVEIDLLRSGRRLPIIDLPRCDYYTMVCRPSQRPKAELWPIKLREVLPPTPIPLSPSDPDVLLDLQAVLHKVYDEGGYQKRIYRRAPVPRLSPKNAAWAAEILAAAGIAAGSSQEP